MKKKEAESEEELSPMKPYASDLSDAEWAILESLIPPAKPGGRPRSVNMLYWLLWTSVQEKSAY